jgi:ABC-2 type transport system permease protein
LDKYFIDLLLALTEKEIKSRYKNAVLGFLWIFINPLIQMLVMGFVFSLIFRFEVKNYYLFLFIGLLPWNFFSLAWQKATPRIVYDRALIQKSNFPREVIPLSMVFSHLFHFLISWALLWIFLILTRQSQLLNLATIISQLLLISLLVIFTAGLSLISASLNVFYRDINFIVQAIILIWFYGTPIIYSFKMIPEKYRWIFYLNPLSGIFSFLQKPLIDSQFPYMVLVGQIGFISLISFIGIYLFKKQGKYFADWV